MILNDSDFKVYKYLASLTEMRQRLQNLIININDILSVIQEFEVFAENHGIALPELPRIQIELNIKSLEDIKTELDNYLRTLIFHIIHELVPGLKDNLGNCKIPDATSDYGKHQLSIMVQNLGKLWIRKDVLEYLRPCISGYCELIQKLQSSEGTEIVSSVAGLISDIKKITDGSAIKASQCVDNLISEITAKGCDVNALQSLKRMESSISSIVALTEYLNDIKGLASQLNQENILIQGNCLNNVFEDFLRSIQYLSQKSDLNESDLSNCTSIDHLDKMASKLQEAKRDYVNKVKAVKERMYEYLELIVALTTKITDRRVQDNLTKELNLLSSTYDTLISELSRDKVNKERVKTLVLELGKLYQDSSTFVCNALLPQLKLSQEEFEILMMLMGKGGKVDFRELSSNKRKVLLDLCERGIIMCYATIGVNRSERNW